MSVLTEKHFIAITNMFIEWKKRVIIEVNKVMIMMSHQIECGWKIGSMKSNLTGWSNHKFLTEQVMVKSHIPGT